MAVQPGPGVRYVLPQRVHTGEGDVSLFFRVTQPVGKCRLTVRSGDTVLAGAVRLKAAPGEMEKLAVKEELLRQAAEPTTVSLEELA